MGIKFVLFATVVGREIVLNIKIGYSNSHVNWISILMVSYKSHNLDLVYFIRRWFGIGGTAIAIIETYDMRHFRRTQSVPRKRNRHTTYRVYEFRHNAIKILFQAFTHSPVLQIMSQKKKAAPLPDILRKELSRTIAIYIYSNVVCKKDSV